MDYGLAAREWGEWENTRVEIGQRYSPLKGKRLPVTAELGKVDGQWCVYLWTGKFPGLPALYEQNIFTSEHAARDRLQRHKEWAHEYLCSGFPSCRTKGHSSPCLARTATARPAPVH